MACHMSDPGQRLAAMSVDQHWKAPTLISASAGDDVATCLEELLKEGIVRAVIDPLDEIATELFDLEVQPEHRNERERRSFVAAAQDEGIEFGTWVHFPWSGLLVRYPTPEQHRSLRTFRNRNLILEHEQARLGSARIAVFGLSVGSNVVDQLVQSGIGGAYMLGDGDQISPTNLNRIRSPFTSVGMRKVDALAVRISESDPFIAQQHLHEGYGSATDDLLAEFRPDVVVEEVDDLGAKARLRRWAKQARVPLISVGDIGEKSVVDVERHDLETVAPFNGKLGRTTYQQLLEGTLPPVQQKRTMIKIVGARHLSARLLRSAAQVGHELAGLPQLGSAASAGAALGSVAIREVLTGTSMRSGSYSMSPRRVLRLGPQTSPRETYDAIRRLRQGLARPLP